MVLKITCKRGGGVKRRPRKVRAGYRYSSRKLVQLSPRYFVAGKSDLSCCIASRGIPKFFAARVGFCNVSGLQQDSLCLRAVLFARVVCTKVSTDTRELYKLLKVSYLHREEWSESIQSHVENIASTLKCFAIEIVSYRPPIGWTIFDIVPLFLK